MYDRFGDELSATTLMGHEAELHSEGKPPRRREGIPERRPAPEFTPSGHADPSCGLCPCAIPSWLGRVAASRGGAADLPGRNGDVLPLQLSQSSSAGQESHMGAKLFAAALGLALVFSALPSSSNAGTFKKGVHVRTFAPPSPYVRVAVKALFDSCWRYREILRPKHRELERIWTCGNYIKPNADFDWGYGGSIADQAARYGHPW
jgi:hypothetical protein